MDAYLMMGMLALDQLDRIDSALETLNSAIEQAGKLDAQLVRVAANAAYTVCNHNGLHFTEWDFLRKLLGVEHLC